jgi:ribosomal-protein-alanine N-acetyltransferase
MTTVCQKSFDPGFRILRGAAEDLPSIVALEEECGLNSRGVEGHRKRLTNPNAILLAAVRDQADSTGRKVAGMFSGEVAMDELQIDNLAVSQSYRRKGVGRMLLQSALSIAHRLRARAAVLEVAVANSPARAFYEREGFVVIGLRKSYYTDPIDDALLLAREIDSGTGIVY